MFLHRHDASPLVASLRHTIFHSPQPPTQDWPLEPKTAARHMIGGSLRCQPLDLWSADLGSNLRTWVRIAVGGS